MNHKARPLRLLALICAALLASCLPLAAHNSQRDQRGGAQTNPKNEQYRGQNSATQQQQGQKAEQSGNQATSTSGEQGTAQSATGNPNTEKPRRKAEKQDRERPAEQEQRNKPPHPPI